VRSSRTSSEWPASVQEERGGGGGRLGRGRRGHGENASFQGLEVRGEVVRSVKERFLVREGEDRSRSVCAGVCVCAFR
jgi:hypothetical protein